MAAATIKSRRLERGMSLSEAREDYASLVERRALGVGAGGKTR
jgi:hypothetical protein